MLPNWMLPNWMLPNWMLPNWMLPKRRLPHRARSARAVAGRRVIWAERHAVKASSKPAILNREQNLEAIDETHEERGGVVITNNTR
jgi:hypothetical protein